MYGAPKALRRGFVEEPAPIVVNGSTDIKLLSDPKNVRTLYINGDLDIEVRKFTNLVSLTLQGCHQLQRDLGELARTNPQLRKLCLVHCGPVNTLPEHIQVLWVERVRISSDVLAGLPQLRELRTFRAFQDLNGLLPVRCEARKVSFEVDTGSPDAFARFAVCALVTQWLPPLDVEAVRLVCRAGADANPSDTIPRPLSLNFTRFTHKDDLDLMAAGPTCRFNPDVPGMSTLVLGPDVVLVTPDGATDSNALERTPPSLERLALIGPYRLRGLKNLKTLVITTSYSIMFPPTYVISSELAGLPRLEELIVDPDVNIQMCFGPITVPKGSSLAPLVPPALRTLCVMGMPMFNF
jgi:hypothetical protein